MNYKFTGRGNHFPWLDALRFIAAFMVLYCHTRHDMFVDYGLLPEEEKGVFTQIFYATSRLGNEAVVIFFVISGFLVGGRGLERVVQSTFNVRGYIIDRAVRIGLPLITSIIFCTIVYVLLDMDFSVITVIGNLFSLQGVLVDNLISPFWSLSYEVWFYIILLAFSLVMGKKVIGLIIMLICCMVFLKLETSYLLIWVFGAFAYLCRPSKSNKYIKYGSFALMVIFAALSNMAAESDSIKIGIKLHRPLFSLLMSASIALFIQQIILCNPTSTIAKKVDHLFSKLADFSYTLYLSHRITLLLIFNYIYEKDSGHICFSGILSYLSILAICLLVSYILYYFTERHTKTIKRIIKSYIS